MPSTGSGMFDPCIVSGRNVLRTELPRPADERSKLQLFLAHHAWVRGASGPVFVREVFNHFTLKFFGFMDQIERNTKPVGDRARIRDCLRSAALILGAGYAILRPQLERDTAPLDNLREQ